MTVEIIVVLQFRYLQEMQLLALHLEIEGYIPLLLYGIVFLRRIGDFNGESLILSRLRKKLLLEAPCKLMDGAEGSFKGVTLTVGNKELGIRTEEAECNLRGEIVIFDLFIIVIFFDMDKIPSDEKRHSYRLLSAAVSCVHRRQNGRN